LAAEFDRHAHTYQDQVGEAVAFAGQEADFFLQVKARHFLRFLGNRFQGTRQLKLLDVGCGVGAMASHLLDTVDSYFGVDVASAAVAQAQRAHPRGTFAAYDGRRLPHDDDSMDAVFAVCVMHHVPPEHWPEFVAEMRRVVKPGGVVAVYEHNPFNPLTRLAVSRCEFDEDAALLSKSKVGSLLAASGCNVVADEYILFFPWRGSGWRSLERGLGWLPLGGQHAVIAANPGR